jgi:hypothetical protein
MNASRPSLSKYVVLDDASARTDRIWLRVADRLASGQRASRRPISHMLALGAALAFAFVVGMFVMRSRAPSGWAQLETSGDAVTVALQDGSRLKLAPQTRLELRESSEVKVALELERGHVDCEVTPNRQRTFAVGAAGFEVLVSGTEFGVDLSRERNRLEVEVRAGEVKVHRRGQTKPEATLRAGQRWSIDLQGPPVSPAAPSDARVPPLAPALRDMSPRAAAPEDAGPASSPAPSPSSTSPSPATRPSSRALDARSARSSSESGQLGARRLLDQGNAARRAGDFDGAARAYELLLSTYPSDRRAGLAAFELGRLRMDRLGDVRGAVVPLEQAAKLVTDPGLREDAMARLVRAFELLGDKERCLDARGLYLDTHPTGVHVGSVAEACGVSKK